MASNNPVLFNAALSGMMAGCLSGRASGDSTASDYAALKNAAVVFATGLDAAIPVNASISAANATVPPATAAEANALTSLPNLLTSLCASYFEGRFTTSTTAGDYTSSIAVIAAAYTEAVIGMDPA
jgi:hypothetical protein